MSILENILKVVNNVPILGSGLNRYLTNQACNKTDPRPRAFSLWSHVKKPTPLEEQGPVGEYTTWPMLADRTYSARHLPPATQSYIDGLPADAPYSNDSDTPSLGDVTALFQRGTTMTEDRSSILFMFFAQWFTDSILRVDPTDRRKNTSTHNIDLNQIYGRSEESARLLRSNQGGKLTSQMINGEEYLDYLGEIVDGTWRVKERYTETEEHPGLPYAKPEMIETLFGKWPVERREKLYATGLERGNSSVGYVVISTLFMREHNRICDELAERNPSWREDDERLFQTARMINTGILLKLVVEDYINHIVGAKVFSFDTGFAEKKDWYRTPWIALEFDLLYRWHGLIPDKIVVNGTDYDHKQYRVNNALLETVGLAAIVDASSTQPAGKISLQNVPKFMLGAEYANIKMGRDFRLRSFNEYRTRFKEDVLTSFDQLTDDRELRNKLKDLYGDIDNVEFVIGLFAEKPSGNKLFGELMTTMVAYDAFTQIYTNPLLSQNVYHAKTLTSYGLDVIDATNTVEDLANRNIDGTVRAGFGL
ncbi:MAG: cyclooxygenase [Gammaproteobacteria bacterium]|nr:cyclooxygenase [Gammaproteobacteria bacterium]